MGFDARDDLIDEYRQKVAEDIDFVFGRFLSGVSDDPRAIVFDILLLGLLDSGMANVIDAAPFRVRAEAIARVLPEPPDGSTRGLSDDQDAVEALMRQRVAAVAQMLATKAAELSAGGKRSGFQDAAQVILDQEAGRLADAFSNAMLLWERVVLDRIGDLMPRALWVYAGPADDRNRPFCAEIVRSNKAYTREQIEALNDHPLLDKYVPPNVFALCGGFNCRHVFLPVPPELAEAQL